MSETPCPRLPKHLAIIMDGNGRWATGRGLKRSEGHRAGAEAAREVITECRRLGIPHLTLYTFSRENWKRPHEEVSFLFRLLVDFLRKELPLLMREDIRVVLLGDLEGLPAPARMALSHVIGKTAGNASMFLNLAMNYSSREELAEAVRRIMRTGVSPDEVTRETISRHLYTAGQPDPDLLIRTSGEQRLSNYLLYQLAYSELYFTDVLWPDFTVAELHKALDSYSRRERRFGRTAAQLTNLNPTDTPHDPES